MDRQQDRHYESIRRKVSEMTPEEQGKLDHEISKYWSSADYLMKVGLNPESSLDLELAQKQMKSLASERRTSLAKKVGLVSLTVVSIGGATAYFSTKTEKDKATQIEEWKEIVQERQTSWGRYQKRYWVRTGEIQTEAGTLSHCLFKEGSEGILQICLHDNNQRLKVVFSPSSFGSRNLELDGLVNSPEMRTYIEEFDSSMEIMGLK